MAQGGSSWLDNVSKTTTILTCLSLIIGVSIGLIQLQGVVRDARSTLNALKLQALNHITGILDTNYQVRQAQRKFLAFPIGKRTDKIKKMIEGGASGEDIYLSDEMTTFRTIAAHYERLGAILDLGYLDFEIMFEIIPFPDRFWVETAALRRELSNHWYGRNRRLPDFLHNFRRLCEKYRSERTKRTSNSGDGLNCNL